MTNKQQSAFFFAIVFLFTSGIGLVIYRQYDQYYQQKTATDLETAQTKPVAIEKSTAQISSWKTYKNDQYGFEFEYPQGWIFVSEFTPPLDGPVLLNFASPEAQKGPHFAEYGGDFNIYVFNNLADITLDYLLNHGTDFGLNFNLRDVAGKTKNILVDDKAGVRFYDVVGESTAQIAIMDEGTKFIEIDDSSQSQIIDQVIPTFKFTN